MRGLLSVSSLVLFFTLGCGVGSDPADPGTKPTEQPGAIETSTIGHSDILDPGSNFQQSLRYWYQKYPMPADLLHLLR